MKFNNTMLGQARGSLGGTTFSRNRGGAYTRQRSKPVQPMTAFQIAVRNANKQSANAYATLTTPSQRQGWNDFAASNPQDNKVGGTMILSAIAMFNKVNVRNYLAGGSGAIVLDAPGALPFLPALTAGPTMGFAGGVLTLDVINSVDFEIGDTIMAYITKSCSPGRTPVHQPSQPLVYVTLLAQPTVHTNYIHIETDPFAVSRVDASPYQMRIFWLRSGNISSEYLFQGLTEL